LTIVMREQLSVKQRQAISETPAKGGGGGLVGQDYETHRGSQIDILFLWASRPREMRCYVR